LRAEGFLAVDVGGSSVKSGFVVDDRVEELAREPVASDLEGLVAQLERLAAGVDEWGLCIPGLVEDGTVRYAANLPLLDTPLPELLSRRPRVFVNDLVAATVGEASGGTLALLQVGTGVAARLAVNGHVLPGGEIGHLRFRDDGPPCRCGNRGCVEAYLRDTDDATDDALEAIGFAAAALVAAWEPGTLRLGGGVAAAWGETLLEAIRSALNERVLPDLAAATTVESARLGDSAALVGLAALATDEPRTPPASRSSGRTPGL
jgi:predicted NBD/HSP70 family sugar kinase